MQQNGANIQAACLSCSLDVNCAGCVKLLRTVKPARTTFNLHKLKRNKWRQNELAFATI